MSLTSQFEASEVFRMDGSVLNVVRNGVARHGNSTGAIFFDAQFGPFRAAGMREQSITEMLLVPLASLTTVQLDACYVSATTGSCKPSLRVSGPHATFVSFCVFLEAELEQEGSE